MEAGSPAGASRLALETKSPVAAVRAQIKVYTKTELRRKRAKVVRAQGIHFLGVVPVSSLRR